MKSMNFRTENIFNKSQSQIKELQNVRKTGDGLNCQIIGEENGDHRRDLKCKKKTVRWTIQQDTMYMKFLEEHAHLFRYKSVRRVRQIFILLSQRMHGRRTPSQCKSHHQKMRDATEKGTIKQILAYLKKKHTLKRQKNDPKSPKKIKQIKHILGHPQIQYFPAMDSNVVQLSIKLDFSLIGSW